MKDIHFFRCGSSAIAIDQISHWWVAPGALGGPALCVSMQNGKQLNLGPEDNQGGDDGYAIEAALVSFIEKCGHG